MSSRAHDILSAFVLGEVPGVKSKASRELHAALDVLCWVLGHDHNPAFAENLDTLASLAAAQGYELKRF